MRFRTPTNPRYKLLFAGPTAARRALVLLLGLTVGAPALCAQPTASGPDEDKRTIQMLLERINRLEARVAKLEADRQETPTAQPAAQQPAKAEATATAPGQASAQVAPPEAAEADAQSETSVEHPEPERMDMSKTLLRMRGFGDITFHGSNQKATSSAFSLGQLNLFITSDISEKFKFLSEIVFEGGPDNIYGVTTGQANTFSTDVERMVLQYSYNDHLNLSVGRWHTAIGYYNTAYHHSTWFQTTTGRPFLFQFEDRGGILPVHTVGLSASGLIPSGSLGLHYVAEIGNGRASRSPLTQEPVQNVVDDQNHKAFNLALFARPQAIHGLQVGFSAYRDILSPANAPRVGETILAAHAVYILSNFEWLNEGVLIRHAPQGQHLFETPGFYTQISRRFGSYRPYFRYQYVNASDKEPVFPDVGRQDGPSVGLRYDASESVALKLQYDYTALRQQPATNSLSLQVGFTF